MNRDEGGAIGGGRTRVAPRSDDVVLELDLEWRIAINPIERDVAAGPRDAGDARRHYKEGFDCGISAKVVDQKLVGRGDIDGKELATCLTVAFEIDQLERIDAAGWDE